ncbi:MAG: hypothetical protein LBP95_13315 [Deltaproteobacteria bacterium]|nr:hypothetical protein [Deltaproteobacteria bacterium]
MVFAAVFARLGDSRGRRQPAGEPGHLQKQQIKNSRHLPQPAGLVRLDAARNKLRGLDVAGLRKLKFLLISSNEIERIDVSANTKLKTLMVEENMLSSLDVSYNDPP